MLRAFALAVAIMAAGSSLPALAQTGANNSITVGRQMNEVTESGAFKNRYTEFDAIRVAAIGGDYNRTLRENMELFYQNVDGSWSMASFTAGPALKAKLDAINALDPDKDKKAFAKLEAEIVKIASPQAAALAAEVKQKTPSISPTVKGISLVNGRVIALDASMAAIAKPTDPNIPSMTRSFASLRDASALDNKRDYVMVYQPCAANEPIAAYTAGGLTALIDSYKKQVGKPDNGFTYGKDGSVFIGSPDDKPKAPQLTSQSKAAIDRKMTNDVMNLLPKLFPDTGSCAVKPFQLRMAEREELPLERDYSGSPLVGTRISDGEVASETKLLTGKAMPNSFAYADARSAQLASACLQFPEIKILIWDGKTVSLYRPGEDIKYSSKSLEEIAAMLKTTPVNKGLTILGIGRGFKNDIKFALVNNIPPATN